MVTYTVSCLALQLKPPSLPAADVQLAWGVSRGVLHTSANVISRLGSQLPPVFYADVEDVCHSNLRYPHPDHGGNMTTSLQALHDFKAAGLQFFRVFGSPWGAQDILKTWKNNPGTVHRVIRTRPIDPNLCIKKCNYTRAKQVNLT